MKFPILGVAALTFSTFTLGYSVAQARLLPVLEMQSNIASACLDREAARKVVTP